MPLRAHPSHSACNSIQTTLAGLLHSISLLFTTSNIFPLIASNTNCGRPPSLAPTLKCHGLFVERGHGCLRPQDVVLIVGHIILNVLVCVHLASKGRLVAPPVKRNRHVHIPSLVLGYFQIHPRTGAVGAKKAGWRRLGDVP